MSAAALADLQSQRRMQSEDELLAYQKQFAAVSQTSSEQRARARTQPDDERKNARNF